MRGRSREMLRTDPPFSLVLPLFLMIKPEANKTQTATKGLKSSPHWRPPVRRGNSNMEERVLGSMRGTAVCPYLHCTWVPAWVVCSPRPHPCGASVLCSAAAGRSRFFFRVPLACLFCSLSSLSLLVRFRRCPRSWRFCSLTVLSVSSTLSLCFALLLPHPLPSPLLRYPHPCCSPQRTC